MKVEILDGGVGHLLKTTGVVIEGLPFEHQFLAGVLANLQDPIRVQEVHSSYLRAGSTVISTNSFSATPYSLSKIKQQHRFHEFIKGAALCAREAVQKTKPDALVAGVLPPLMECYHEPGMNEKELETIYDQIVKILEPHVDLFLCETMCSLKEALSVSRTYKRLWISFTLEDSLENVLRNGESFKETIGELLRISKKPDAILVNCSSPMTVSSALECVGPELISEGIPFGGYANAFKTTTTQWLTSTLVESCSDVIQEDEYDAEGVILCEAYCQHVKTWRNQGASIFGGCCGTTPDHIKQIAQLLSHS